MKTGIRRLYVSSQRWRGSGMFILLGNGVGNERANCDRQRKTGRQVKVKVERKVEEKLLDEEALRDEWYLNHKESLIFWYF